MVSHAYEATLPEKTHEAQTVSHHG
jgi:hypothetical protein